jgi:hypothetical protein
MTRLKDLNGSGWRKSRRRKKRKKGFRESFSGGWIPKPKKILIFSIMPLKVRVLFMHLKLF